MKGRVDNSEIKDRREALREAVLAAAEARVAASGLAALGVREVAREAGCSLGMVYKLFASHDDLVLAVNARTLRALGRAMAASLQGIDDPTEALCRVAEGYLEYAIANVPRWDALFAHRMAGSAALPVWYASLRDEMFASLAIMIGAVAPAAAALPGDFARTLFSAVHGIVALGLQEKVGALSFDTLKTELRVLISVIARGLSLPR